MPWEKSFDVDRALDRAMNLFWSGGFEATSMQALIDQMGINRASLYDTYGDKRSLFIATLRRYDEDLRRSRLAALERRHPPKAAVQALFRGWVDEVLEDPDRCGCFLTNTALELATHDEEIAGIVATSQRETEAFFLRLIQAGQATGEIPATVDPKRTAKLLLATLIGLLVLARSRPEHALLTSIANGALASLE